MLQNSKNMLKVTQIYKLYIFRFILKVVTLLNLILFVVGMLIAGHFAKEEEDMIQAEKAAHVDAQSVATVIMLGGGENHAPDR